MVAEIVAALALGVSIVAALDARKSRAAAEKSADAAVRQSELADEAELRRREKAKTEQIRFYRAFWRIAADVHACREILQRSKGGDASFQAVADQHWADFERESEVMNEAAPALQLRAQLVQIRALDHAMIFDTEVPALLANYVRVESEILSRLGSNVGEPFPTEEQTVSRMCS